MPQIDTVLDSALLIAKILEACCEIPVLKFLKPAAALAVVICETAKTVIGNADAAKELSEHTTEILHLIVDHLRQVPLTEISPDLERDAVKLWQTLENVNQHLLKLKKRKRKVYALLWAQKDKEYLNELKSQLDEVLITFGVSRTLAVNREVARVQGIVHETNQDVKLMLSRLENTSCLRRLDEPRVIHGDNVRRESALSKYLEYIPESSSGDGQTVTAIRLYKATYHGLHGDVLPIIALDYSGIAETDFVVMCWAGPGSKARAWAGLLWAWAYGDAEPSPVGGLGLSWAWLGLGPRLGL